ncbi:hypothetical protein L208DRAFT_1451461 [Tricholoma matsutake]|nr:hypothetical protein L208DRAFT_1451461 [Tricholoma matsutake 945]
MSTVSINLKPVSGFCIKSTTIYTPSQSSLDSNHASIPVPIGYKVFINIAWDPNVPSPPAGSEEIIQRAMKGDGVDNQISDGWYVPVFVSDGRQDKDKAGNPSLVFDCIYNSSLKSRTLTNPEFKIFLVELALQRLEAQTSLVLSRQIGTPNIASKGKLLPRTVSMPAFLFGNSAISQTVTASVPGGPLIQEVAPEAPLITSQEQPFNKQTKGILKSDSSSQQAIPSIRKANSPSHVRSPWSWSKEHNNDRLAIVISVPSIAPSIIAHATLDVEPRRFILTIPDFPVLDVNLNLSDAEIVSRAQSATSMSLHSESEGAGMEPNNTLTLKRQRDLDVDGATAEWNITKSILVLTV